MEKLDLVPKVLEKLGVSLVFHHGAASGQADVVQYFPDRSRGVRAARQPGFDAGLLSRFVLPALRAPWAGARRQPASRSPHRWKSSAFALPCR
jgi:hypothetical protein